MRSADDASHYYLKQLKRVILNQDQSIKMLQKWREVVANKSDALSDFTYNYTRNLMKILLIITKLVGYYYL